MPETSPASTRSDTAEHRPSPTLSLGRKLLEWVSTTDHKVIGKLYIVTAFCFFLLGGLLAMGMRAELTSPGLQFMNNQTYNELFTIHGTIMMLLFATPMFSGFTNAVMPLQIGAPDLAFPRLNALSYWMYLFGGLIVVSGVVVPGGPAAFGWFAYAPLNSALHSPGAGGDLWVMGLVVTGVSTTLSAVNFIATISTLRAPGMTMFRMPIFTWNVLFTSILVLPAFPVLTAALLALEADRKFGAHIYDSANGG
ncbi:cbb3-type cytochrome c oxidase subunit I, partial [Streptomyces kebangsaanensis]|uniref:cbb3-type cytochrome c oxidase subunit I n=1 Tax=Streptomyces kebangsaanensis TaxID=864058 RepID=UPI001F1E02D4